MLNLSRYTNSIVPLSILLLITACSDTTQTNELTKVSNPLNGKWDTGCLENPQLESNPDAPTGYVRETLEFSLLTTAPTATQTFEYFQDANCTLAVTSNQVTNNNETFFLRKQSQQMSVSFAEGETTTELGEAQFLNLQVISISIDDVVQSDKQLQQLGIVSSELLGLFIVTDSERLHINAAADIRPATVPLDYFYDRVAD